MESRMEVLEVLEVLVFRLVETVETWSPCDALCTVETVVGSVAPATEGAEPGALERTSRGFGGAEIPRCWGVI